MAFSGGHMGFDDSGTKPKQGRGKGPHYNTAVRKRRGKRGRAHMMHPKSMDRVKGS